MQILFSQKIFNFEENATFYNHFNYVTNWHFSIFLHLSEDPDFPRFINVQFCTHLPTNYSIYYYYIIIRTKYKSTLQYLLLMFM